MGWNSYDCFGYSVTEDQVRENAAYMSEHLKRFGWQYVVIDFVWSMPKLPSRDVPAQNADFQPRLAMDEYGRLLPDPARFPSSAGGKGFKPLAAWIHRQGLKYGIHLMRGIPRQAVAQRSPIWDSGKTRDPKTAADAANVQSACPWLNHMWGLNMVNPAGQKYLDSIFHLYAEWGVDFVKVDDLSRPYDEAEVAGYRKAIERCGRPMVLSLSPGPTPLDEAKHVVEHANMWRLLDDLWDNWNQLDNAFGAIAAWTAYRGPNHWPDLDMLPLGQLRVYGPRTGPPNTKSRFSEDEAHTLISLWCIAKCPLMFGGDLPQTDAATLELITNARVIAINQRSSNNRLLVDGQFPVWAADSPNPKIKYLALFNRSDHSAAVNLSLSEIGIKTCGVTDLWKGQDRGLTTGNLVRTVPSHGVALLEISVVQATNTSGRN